jgi:hypothetical protein
MLDQLDEAIRSVLADIAATSPSPEDVNLGGPLSGRARARWLLPAVAAVVVALVVGLVVVNSRERTQPISHSTSTALPSSTTVAATELELDGVLTRYPTVTARVISPAEGATVVTIDHGSSDGVQVGMAVASVASLIGMITAVSKDTSKVRLIIDPAYSIECTINGAAAACQGDGNTVRVVPPPGGASSVEAGGIVTTAGGSASPAPPDLVVGRLPDAANGDGTIELAADLAHLNFVSVIRYVPPNAVPG